MLAASALWLTDAGANTAGNPGAEKTCRLGEAGAEAAASLPLALMEAAASAAGVPLALTLVLAEPQTGEPCAGLWTGLLRPRSDSCAAS